MLHKFKKYDITFSVWYVPERPAPPCINPDSPAFSDCGDDGEFYIESAVTDGGVDIYPHIVNAGVEDEYTEKVQKWFDAYKRWNR